MASKIIESKIVVKGDDQASMKMEKINQAIAQMGNLAKEAAENLGTMMSAITGGGGPRGGKGRAGVAAGRSEHAPPPGVREAAGKYEGGREHGGKDKDGKLYPGWHSGMRFAGAAMGVAGGIAGAVQGAMTPAIAGGLTSIGGAISSVSMMGFPIGAAAGLPMMAGGLMLGAQYAAAQPAIQHYQQYGASYRVMGHKMAENAKRIGTETQAFTPDESVRIQRELYNVGAQAAFRPLAKMKFGGGMFETELMQPFFQAATKAGAAGTRKEEEYRKLAKIMAVAFADKTKLPSMAQAMETMTGLTGAMESHLGDIKEDQVKYLSALSEWMNTSGTAALKGQRGVQTMSTMMGVVAGAGSPAQEMIKWQAFKEEHPTGGWAQYQYWKQDPRATLGTLRKLSKTGMGGEFPVAPIIAGQFMGLSPEVMKPILETVMKNPNISWEELLKKHPNAATEFKAGGKHMEDIITAGMANEKSLQLAISEHFAPGAIKFETAALKFALAMEKLVPFEKATEVFTSFITELTKLIDRMSSEPAVVKEHKAELKHQEMKTRQLYGFGATPMAIWARAVGWEPAY